ncbi:hypothetical protein J2855_004743 [Agrobacterium tumefaciens]|uniref:hypothetical protein n=1 Tax=Agrobacterium tumefaciens TaxID=358 RepID=UPI0013AEAF29|nr:hypothetical protein [Agrobacterium tumefaciens]MBP2511088.1 hypothetical protein [Agrobacterium tumefaciens]MBP2520313.1 hypothetical protein [Agrobacterium tumefaciens]MBP2578983.1 hypothetical protein [Agrobacterium tumefaciens]MBP2597276.1 hypothetical protein [Agrobacterium tumefaciens]
MLEIPESLFDVQKMLADSSERTAQALATDFRPYHAKSSIAAVGGLLTVPHLQANTVRLEAISHLVVSNATGKKKPTKQDASRWFRQVGQAVTFMEDAAEDVFVGRVNFEGRNYLVLEGLAEANCHHLQHMLNVLKTMPDIAFYAVLREACRTLLLLSDQVCSRAGLNAFIPGSEYKLSSLPFEQLPTLKTLAKRVTFTESEIFELGGDPSVLGRFFLSPSDRHVGIGLHGNSSLERCPLIHFEDEVVVALPSAVGLAIRRAIIETCIEIGTTNALYMGLLQSQTNQISLNPTISGIDIPPTQVNPSTNIIPSRAVEFQPGCWFHLVLAADDFANFSETGFDRPNPDAHTLSATLADVLQETATECEEKPGFKLGLSLVVLCGFGRGQLLELRRPDGWFVEGISGYDLEVLGWKNDFDIAELLKFLLAEIDAASKGFPLMAINGILARIGFAYGNRGHVVPHDALPDGAENATLMVPTNAHLDLRVQHHSRFDEQAVVAPDGEIIVVRRKYAGKRSPEKTQKIYVSYSDASRGRFRAVWKSRERNWWLETVPNENQPIGLYPVFEMQTVWMEHIAPLLDQAFPDLPDTMTWRLITSAWPQMKTEDICPPSAEEIHASIRASHCRKENTIVTEISSTFFYGLSHAENISESALVQAVVREVVQFSNVPKPDIAGLMVGIIPSPHARQLHAFAPQDFRDHVRHSIDRTAVNITAFDDAAIRIGLGWHGVPRPGGIIRDQGECTRALNAITVAAEEAFCLDLSCFERRALIERVVANREASILDKRRWERTSAAILSLASDHQGTRDEIFEQLVKANGTDLASRIILEAAICECPVGSGYELADIDLSRLMAQAMMIHYLGGYSDAIHYEGMKPEIRISPAGEVQIDTTFFDTIVEPVGRSFATLQLDRHRKGYTSLLRDPELSPTDISAHVEVEFLNAWEAELGISLVEFRTALEALENYLYEKGLAYEILPRNDVTDYLNQHIGNAEAFIAALELIPRSGWKNVSLPFSDQDRQPWRFRRRLSVARRPIIRIDSAGDAEILIAPGMIRDAFAIMLHNYHQGQFDLGTLHSKEMKRWRERIVAKEAAEFEERVVTRLKELGWNARRGAKFPHVLGKALSEDPGDIDVLAWHNDGRVMLLECKDLQFAKTPSEIAKQLSKFRGQMDEKGRPDLLAKHIKRVALATEHKEAFRTHLSLSGVSIDGTLVFANTVPMSFAAERIGHSVRLLTYDQLGPFFGSID